MIIYIANLKSFLNQHTDSSLILSSSKFSLPVLSFFICIKHHFILKVLFQSHLIRHFGRPGAFKDTQQALKHSRYSNGTQALWHSKGTRVLGNLRRSSTQGTQALGHSDIQDNQALQHFIQQTQNRLISKHGSSLVPV